MDSVKYVEKECKQCDDLFSVKPSISGQTFCSNECFYEYRKKRVSAECEVCGKDVERTPSHTRDNTFCSWECYSENRYEDLSSIKNTKKIREWVAAVKERDDHTCQECGNADTVLHAHHIVPVSVDESKAFDLENGKTLCVDCHSSKHPALENLILSHKDQKT